MGDVVPIRSSHRSRETRPGRSSRSSCSTSSTLPKRGCCDVHNDVDDGGDNFTRLFCPHGSPHFCTMNTQVAHTPDELRDLGICCVIPNGVSYDYY